MCEGASRGHRVLDLSLLSALWWETKMKLLLPAISPIWLSSNLLFFPLHSYCSLVAFYRVLCCTPMEFNKASQVILLFWSGSSSVHLTPRLLLYASSPWVLCCWWATEQSLIPNTVWARAHTRGELDWSVHSSVSFWSVSQRKNIPMGHSPRMSVLLRKCVYES